MELKRYSWNILIVGFVLLALGLILSYGFIPTGFAMVMSAGFCLIFTKTVEKHCTLYCTATALGLSAFGGAGLYCAMETYRIAILNKVQRYPIRYPLSIAGGLACLVVFFGLIALYFFTRKGKFTAIGFILDILTSILYLPSFFLLFALLTEIISLF